MEVSMTKIAVSALLSVVLGFFLGAVYDVFRFFRVLFGISVQSPFKKRGIRPYVSWILSSLGDLLFMLIAAVCTCVFFFLTGDGRMRGYGLVGEFLGFELYYHTVGKLFIGIVDFIAGFIKKKLRCLGGAFLRAPIVMRLAAWYNENTKRRKEAAKIKKRRKKMAKNGYIKNGF